MHLPKYLYKSDDSFLVFQFDSIGPMGNITKVVQYAETGTKGIFNLAFGDFNEDEQTIDDLSITNNGDSQKVLATVASTVYAFFDKYPDAYVFATGSTNSRTRLYRMGISMNYLEIRLDFDIFGLDMNGLWEDFVLGKDYQAFLIKRTFTP